MEQSEVTPPSAEIPVLKGVAPDGRAKPRFAAIWVFPRGRSCRVDTGVYVGFDVAASRAEARAVAEASVPPVWTHLVYK